jgi:hypothetical protein
MSVLNGEEFAKKKTKFAGVNSTQILPAGGRINNKTKLQVSKSKLITFLLAV